MILTDLMKLHIPLRTSSGDYPVHPHRIDRRNSLRIEGGMELGYLPRGRDIIISPTTLSLSIFESIDCTFYPIRPNRPDAIFNQLAPTIQQTLQPLRAVVVTTKRLESMLKES